MNCEKEALEKGNTKDFIQINAYCLMDNHSHELNHYLESSIYLSDYMRRSHSQFGRVFNDLNNRSGKVAESRPKTPLIEDWEHLMRVHFYIEANPVRAGKIPLEKLKNYKYCSYRYYAYGIEDEYTKMLTPPEWYLALGKTARERQKKYRKLFAAYLREQGLIAPPGFSKDFIGSPFWIQEQKDRVKAQKIRLQGLSHSDSS